MTTQSMPLIGIVGKPNVGKSSLFKALTMADVKIANYPFTTTYDPNIGIGYVSVKCVCKELGVKDNPRNSVCINGIRFIGVKVIDIGGLVPGAYMGRGIGNLFLDHIRRADVLLHVIDVSGSTDAEGNIIGPGKHDPMEDIQFIEEELSMWFFNILKRNWRSIINRIRAGREKPVDVLSEMLSGLKIRREHIKEALREAELSEDDIIKMKDEDIQRFANKLIKISKPMVVVANKIDIDPGEDNYRELVKKLDLPVIPCCCIAEIALKMAAKNGFIEYVPGESDFKIIDASKLTSEQEKALAWIKENILDKYGGTGVQKAINTAVFDVLNMIVVFPVEDEYKYTDHHGNVLPDAILVSKGITIKKFAEKIHTELAETFIHGIVIRNGKLERVGADFILENRDIVKIVAAKSR